jgi:hypothetical protein
MFPAVTFELLELVLVEAANVTRYRCLLGFLHMKIVMQVSRHISEH